MPSSINRPRGTIDVLPGEVEKWQYVEESFRRICREYGYAEIRTPVFEYTELFDRGVGDTTDIIEKEMYTFLDRSERSLSLRPEGTAPIARAYVEDKLYSGPQPVKVYYQGPMFRYDRPQAGRYRQFHQLGAEVFGSFTPAIDAEVVAMAMDFCRRFGLKLDLHINSVGCGMCRPVMREKLCASLKTRLEDLCGDCRIRLDKNPLRILDCKVKRCREMAGEAAAGLKFLCPECADHFGEVLSYLDALNVEYIVDHCLVRGLDYYTRTAFEIMAPGIGAQRSVGGGGRYDGLVEMFGGPPTPGIGYAMGLERFLLVMQEQGLSVPDSRQLDVYLVTAEKDLEGRAMMLLQELRTNGIYADKDYTGRSMKAQLKQAGKSGAPYVVILGSDELSKGKVALKDMLSGSQTEVPLSDLTAQFLKE
ncbi:MAG: Histidine--tRNA ligase [Desulfofundulus kuznetsovii]|nr:MAG: Histidine--tRNA ligase [Desulfotomaculum sp. 46_80]KUK85176.1 MAG: Histidine--tRNA ligase [Desulfofundulus kuznetsovii]